MKLGKSVLIEIMRIVQDSILAQEDASAALRKIDVVVKKTEEFRAGISATGDPVGSEDVVELSDDYLKG